MARIKKESNNLYIRIMIIYLAIIVAQVVILFYWMNNKSNFYCDELYSLGYSRQFGSDVPTYNYVWDSPQWKTNEWMDDSELKACFSLNEDTDFFPVSLSKISHGIMKRPYFVLLNLVRTINGEYGIDKYSGIYINIVIAVLSDILMILLMNSLNMRSLFKTLLFAMFCLSPLSITMNEYIRFYSMDVMLLLLILLMYSLMRKSQPVWKIILYEFISAVSMFLAIQNSELFVIISGMIFVLYFADIIIRKESRKIWVHTGFTVLAFAFVLKTKYFDMLVHPSRYAGNGGTGQSLFNFLLHPTLTSLEEGAITGLDSYSRYLFGGIPIFLLWAAVLTVFFILLGKQHGKSEQKISVTRLSLLIAWGVVAFLALYLYEFRLFMLAGFAVYFLWMYFPIVKAKVLSVKPTFDDGMIIIIAASAIVYTLFVIYSHRCFLNYFVYGMIPLLITMWYGIDKGIGKLDLSEQKIKICYAIMISLTAITCLAPFVTRDIKYVYESDGYLAEAVTEYLAIPEEPGVVLVFNSSVDSKFHILDCIWHLEDDTDIYIEDYYDYTYKNGTYPENFILWSGYDMGDTPKIKEGLIDEGYSVELLGKSYTSQVFVAKK